MPAEILPTTQRLGTLAFVTIVAAPVAGEVKRVDLTAMNVTAGGTLGAAYAQIVDALDAANTGPIIAPGYPVPPPPDPDCTVILKYGLMLTEGQSLQIKAGALNSVAYSAEVVRNDA